MLQNEKMEKTIIAGLSALMIGYGMHKMMASEYSRKVCKEIPKLVCDWCAGRSPKISPSELYMDLHFHFDMPEDVGGLENMVDKAMEKVDVVAITGRGKKKEQKEDERHLLTYDKFKEMLRNSEKYKSGFEDKGKLAVIRVGNDLLYVIKGQEILTNEGMEILALGCEKNFYEKEGTLKTIRYVNSDGGISIIAHPYTISTKRGLGFRLANKKEEAELKELAKEADAIEQFNSDNTLWMFRSNVKAKMFSNGYYGPPGVAATDGHGNLNLIGNSGIIVDRYYLDMSTGDAFIARLKDIIWSYSFRIHTRYTNPVNFVKEHGDLIKRIKK